MSEQESKPSLKPRVALRFEVEAPFGVLDFETEDAISMSIMWWIHDRNKITQSCCITTKSAV